MTTFFSITVHYYCVICWQDVRRVLKSVLGFTLNLFRSLNSRQNIKSFSTGAQHFGEPFSEADCNLAREFSAFLSTWVPWHVSQMTNTPVEIK